MSSCLKKNVKVYLKIALLTGKIAFLPSEIAFLPSKIEKQWLEGSTPVLLKNFCASKCFMSGKNATILGKKLKIWKIISCPKLALSWF